MGTRDDKEGEEERMQKRRQRWKDVRKFKMGLRRTANEDEKAGREAG